MFDEECSCFLVGRLPGRRTYGPKVLVDATLLSASGRNDATITSSKYLLPIPKRCESRVGTRAVETHGAVDDLEQPRRILNLDLAPES